MKKVLILSYFAPPCNLTAAQRITSWYNNLPKHDYYPILISRHWTGKEKNEQERLADTNQSEKIVKSEHSEIHYLNYHSSWRDKAFIKSPSSRFFAFISKVLTY